MGKCYLGSLCKRGHMHENTSLSLRRKDCRACVLCSRMNMAKWRSRNQEAVKEINARPENRAMSKVLKKTDKHRDAENERRRRPYVREAVRQHTRQRYATDEDFRIRCCLRSRLTEALKSIGTRKSRTCREYGIDWQAIADHLGPCPGPRECYHIDHIRPLSSFNLTDHEQVRIAFAPGNHQWLPALENRRKGARLEV